ncbi:DNA helicase RecQ [Alkalibacillus silvisoli]|uniref:DNA helicase RecQ n=1 Tax=Alkalibacillus silvisoli TaxID=392823 RepID=A0ABN0ZQF3_9BACI
MINQAVHTLNHYYGFSSFRPGQEEAIRSILNKNNTLAIMPTGGGKSLCYQIPSLVLDGTAIIISPLISLMNDQVEALNATDIPATYINSSLDGSEQQHRLNEMVNGNYKMVYVSPERFETPHFLNMLEKVDLSLIAFDEAHCISQWGHDFRPSYRSVVPYIKQLSQQPPTIALTATATQQVIHDIKNLLNIDSEHTVVTGFARENLKFKVIKGVNPNDYLNDFINTHLNDSGIIYTPTRKTTDQIYESLSEKGIQVARYHAGMSKDERQVAQAAFISDNVQVMVATNAFGMGIDKSNVRYVIHYALPKNIESYYQEAGRAGRDGVESECHLLFSPKDIQLQKFLIEQSDLEEDQKRDEYQKLQDMIAFCHTTHCLQGYILDYFGDRQNFDHCGKCSNCLDDGNKEDMTKEAQMILSCVKRMNEKFGITLTAKVLKGSKSQKVIDFRLDQLSTYGLLSHYTEKEITNLINYLVADQYLQVTDAQFPVLKLTANAIPVLKNEEKVWMKVPEQKKAVQAGYSEELFQALRELRKEIADEQSLPPYMIFSDATLKELARHVPATQPEMLQVKGIGEKKYEQYGEPFLTKLKAFREENEEEILANRTAHPVQPKIKKEKKDNDKPSYLVSYELFTDGKDIDEIVEERTLAKSTITSHLFKAYEEGHTLDLERFFTGEAEQEILTVIDELKLEEFRYKPIKDALPDDITYTMIKAVCLKHELI